MVHYKRTWWGEEGWDSLTVLTEYRQTNSQLDKNRKYFKMEDSKFDREKRIDT